MDIKNNTNRTRNMNMPNKLRRTGVRMKTIAKRKILNIHFGTQLLEKCQVWEKQYGNGSASQQQEICLDDSNEDYSLIISNLPRSWTIKQIKDFIETECGKIESLELIDTEGSFDVEVQFKTKEQFEKSKEIFNNKIIEDVNSEKEEGECSEEEDLEAKSNETPNPTKAKKISVEPEFDLWENDPQGLYGLKPEFLDSLNITPPINNWVHVSNFRCDKSELRDAMEIAGRVLFCAIVTKYSRYAKVMYSHPLEAVQAVSMLHDQKFYGSRLIVTMEVNANNIVILPKGLRKIGPGLGKLGKPIRNIAQHYERYVNNQSSLVNPNYFMEIDRIDNNITTEKLEVDSGVKVVKNEVVVENDKKGNGEENDSHINDTQESAQRPLDNNIGSDHSTSQKFQPPSLPLKVRTSTPRTETPYFKPPLPQPLNSTQETMANLPPANAKNVMFQNMYLNPLLQPKVCYPFPPPREFIRAPHNVMRDTNTRQNLPTETTDHFIFPSAGVKSSEPNSNAFGVGATASGPGFLRPRPLFPNHIEFHHPYTLNLPHITSPIEVGPTVTNPVTSVNPLSGTPGLYVPAYFGFPPPAFTPKSEHASTSIGSSSEHGAGVFRPPGPPGFGSMGCTVSGPGFVPLGCQVIPPHNPMGHITNGPGAPGSFFSEPKPFGSFGSGRRRTGRRGSRPCLLTVMPKPISPVAPPKPVAVAEVKVEIEEPEVDDEIGPIKLEDSASDILSNLPPNTTLQMLCDKILKYEQELSSLPGPSNTATKSEEFNVYQNRFSGDE